MSEYFKGRHRDSSVMFFFISLWSILLKTFLFSQLFFKKILIFAIEHAHLIHILKFLSIILFSISRDQKKYLSFPNGKSDYINLHFRCFYSDELPRWDSKAAQIKELQIWQQNQQFIKCPFWSEKWLSILKGKRISRKKL